MGQESLVLTFEPFAEENHQVEEQPKMEEVVLTSEEEKMVADPVPSERL